MLTFLLMACVNSEPESSLHSESVETAPVRVEVGGNKEKTNSALAAYDQALAFREQEKWIDAVTAFKKAIEMDVSSPSLRLWLAQTHLDMGRDDLALAVLNESVRLFPEDSDCLYNRAAVRARMRDIGGAADDLKRLKSLGLLDPLETGLDPDFSTLRSDPVFHDLVQPPRIDAVARGEAGPVLLGEPWQLHLSLTVPANGELSMEWVDPPGAWVDLDSVMEREIRREGGLRVLEVRIRWLAIKAGQGQLGPWMLRLGTAETIVEALPVEVLALGQLDARPQRSGLRQIPLPSALIQEGGAMESAEWLSEVRLPEHSAVPKRNGQVSLEWRQADGSFHRATAWPK